MHPHNRYDAILSARLRQVGARFFCNTAVLADHLYGAPILRPTARTMRVGQFLRESFFNKRSVFHFVGGLVLAWEAAPTWLDSYIAVFARLAVFLRQLVGVIIFSIKAQHHRPRSIVLVSILLYQIAFCLHYQAGIQSRCHQSYYG